MYNTMTRLQDLDLLTVPIPLLCNTSSVFDPDTALSMEWYPSYTRTDKYI
jgi:hypothetical protein